ncbi:uncharacterized protein LOC129925748 [Biomphalaria glabrata]|uniref:Uncharacterized protein LOC129925748 n=1 Tax=Biomphalaria glabrata TaxID=6526 RepID=A0A9W3A4L9_BIOGL|nr:uncharacterized protein LOC129925748 [Biomphalaria glabrata]
MGIEPNFYKDKDKDREERAAERAHQKELKELETKQKELEAKQKESQDKVELAKLEAAKINPNIMTLQTSNKPFIFKFHKFNIKEETLENDLVQFEHISSTYNLNNEDMAKHLLANLSGEPLNIISTLTTEQKKDYIAVKTRLLEHFGKSKDYYRKLFKKIKLNKDGNFNRIIFDMKANMLKWLELAKCDIKDPNQILDMILIDNVLSNVTDLVFTFLKEKKVKTETDLITNLNLFKDSHPGHTMDKRELHQLAATVNTANNSNSNDRFKFSNSKTCFNCGKKGHVKSQCRQTSTSNFRYRSYTNYHNPSNYNQNNYNNHSNYSNQYRNYRSNQSASPRERRSLRNNNSYYNNYNTNRQSKRDTYNHQSNYNNYQNRNRNRGNTNINTQREENVAYLQTDMSKVNVFPSYVNSVEIKAVRDTGATTSIVRSNLVKPEQYLEETVKVIYANIQKFDICKTAKVWIESPWITGEIKVVVMDTPAQDLIIGNSHGVKDLTITQLDSWIKNRQRNWYLDQHHISAVQTRSHKNIVPEIELPNTLFNEIGTTRQELIKMQNSDPIIQDLLNKDYNKINLNNHHLLANNLAIRCNRNKDSTRIQIIILESLQPKILKMAHDDPTAGHFGKKKTYAKISQKFFWPKMKTQIKDYIDSCAECTKQKLILKTQGTSTKIR